MESTLSKQLILQQSQNNITIPTTTSYNFIDLFKFICAILIVCIHTSALYSYGATLNFILVNIIARLGVPFFFLCSGYFLFKKIHNISSSYHPTNKKYFKSYMKRLISLYLIWSSIYFIINLHSWSESGGITSERIVSSIKGLLFAGIKFHLWYMAGLILATILVYYSLKYLSLKITFIIASGLYIIGLLGDSYFGLIKDIPIINSIFNSYNSFFITTRNGLFFGFIFILLGSYFAKNTIKLTSHKLLILFISSFVLLFLEGFTINSLNIAKDYNMYIFLVPCTSFLFLLLLNTNLKHRSIYIILRNLSTLIYFSHIIFEIFHPNLINILHLDAFYYDSILKFSIVLSFSLIFSLILLGASKLKPFKFLKLLY